jgi:hypothetical protein
VITTHDRAPAVRRAGQAAMAAAALRDFRRAAGQPGKADVIAALRPLTEPRIPAVPGAGVPASGE